MSVQCTAHAVRALAALPSPASPRRRASHVSLLPCRPSRAVAPVRAVDSSSPPPAPASSTDGKAVVPDDEFSLAKVSFGVIGLGVGGTLLSYGFGAYFNLLPGSEWSALMLTYGFPLTIIGMALKYAELKPVPCITYSDALALREKCATPILQQVRSDVTRYRYGDEQHLDEALKRIFQYGLGGGIPRRSAPILQKIREEVTEDGKYCLVLVFEAKALELSDFEKRQEKVVKIYMKFALSQRLHRKHTLATYAIPFSANIQQNVSYFPSSTNLHMMLVLSKFCPSVFWLLSFCIYRL